MTIRDDGRTLYPYAGPALFFVGWGVQCPSCERWGDRTTTTITRWQEGRKSEAWRCSTKSIEESIYECSCGAVWTRVENNGGKTDG